MWPLPARKTCPEYCKKICWKNCFAWKAERIWPDVKLHRAVNYHLASTAPKLMIELNVRQMRRSKLEVYRPHPAGDFFNNQYIRSWATIAKEFPEKTFYTMTKALPVLNFKPLLKLDNFNLIDSMIDGHVNFGNAEHIHMLQEEYGAFLCPASVDKKKFCNVDCTYCHTNSTPAFLQH